MIIKTITAGHSRKEGRPGYGSEDYHFSITVEVEPGENLTDLSASMFETCKQKVNEQFAEATQITPHPPVKVPVKFDWKDTRAGENWLAAKAEQSEEHGADNGPRGYREEESISGQH